jgi:hypothetical protein
MTEPAVVERTVPAPPKVSFWEDLIDIFFSPAAVFRREEHKSFWPPMLFVALAIGVIVFVTFNTLEPIFDAEFTRSTAKQIAANPRVTPEQLEVGKRIGMNIARYAVTVIIMLTMFVLGIFTWLLGKLVGSAQTFHAAFVVAAWSYVPRVLGAILGGVQGLVMDTSKFNSQLSISLSPARFMDADTANPLLYQFAGRFDLITIWVTILLAIGMYVTGKVSKGRAAVFGVLIWILGALPALRAAFLAM